ncbi:MAG: helix-turn-helix domain-containing protein [Actinomycetota bacterium]|nr:helix-turn-helix domain-containing protein [Actinomycetota bacterium]
MPEPPPFGVELRRRRVAAGLSLGALAERVHYSKGYLSKVESGHNLASTGLARLCDAALDAHGELLHLLPAIPARGGPDDQPDDADRGRPETWLVGIGDNGGYFTPVGDGPMADSTATVLGMVFGGRAGVDTHAALAPFLTRFDEARNLGQVAGSVVVFPLVIVETRTLQLLAEHAPPNEQAALFQLAARYAEFAGWMAQEAGDDRMAWWLTMKAVGMADAAGDPSLRPYALVRRADIALYQDDALSVIELASRAQQQHRAPLRIRGLAAQREAQGHALAGDHTACLRAIERSAVLLGDAASGAQAGPALGTARTPDLVALTQGWCLHDLGRPAEAGEILDAGIALFEPWAHRARVRYQARAALAYATAGELERASELIIALLDQAQILDSATIRHDLRSLTKVLGRWRAQPTVCALLPALTAVLQEKRNAFAADMLRSH